MVALPCFSSKSSLNSRKTFHAVLGCVMSLISISKFSFEWVSICFFKVATRPINRHTPMYMLGDTCFGISWDMMRDLNSLWLYQASKIYFIFIGLLILFCMWTLYLSACMCTMYITGTQGSQKRILDPLKLELWMVVNHFVGSENWIWVLCRGNKYS